MPDLSSNLTAMRASGHQVYGYLVHHPGTLVMTATLSATPSGDPVTTLAVTVSSGSAANVKAGYLVRVETSGGVYKGRTYVRFSGTIDATSLPIREMSPAELTFASGDVVKVYSVVPLRDKLVTDDATFSPDGLAYVEQGYAPAPVACSGGHAAAFVDAGETFATIVTKGDSSYTVDPNSAGTVTHLWTLPTGVAFAAGSANTDANPTLEVNAGTYTVIHAVTDSYSGYVTTQYVQYTVLASVDDANDCLVENLRGDEINGWSATVRMFDNATLTDISDGSLVTLFVEEYINGARQSFGNVISDRSTVKLTGYLVRDTSSGNAEDTGLTFEVVSPLARLRQFTGYSKVMLRATNPLAWNELFGLTVKRGIINLVQNYSTLIEAGFDLIFDVTDYDYPAFYIQKSTPYDQILELADGIDARFVCDRAGRFEVHTRPELIALSSRSAVTTTATLTAEDVIEYEFSREHWDKVELVECRGFVAAAVDASAVTAQSPKPIFCRYPGRAPLLSVGNQIVERKIAASQSNLNSRGGRIGAALNGDFIDSSNREYRISDLRITLRGSYDAFDFYKEYVLFASGALTNRRNLDLSVFRFYVYSVDVSYDNGTARVELTLKPATHGNDAQTYIPPSTEFDFPPFPPPPVFPPIQVPDYGDGTLKSGTNRIALMLEYETIAVTTNFNSPSPTWTITDLNLLGGTMYAVGDPFTAGRIYLLTPSRIYEVTDIFGTPTPNELHTVPSGGLPSWHGSIETERSYNSPVVACIHNFNGTNGVYVMYSTDRGNTWTDYQVTTTEFTTSGGPSTSVNTSPVSVSSHTGNVYITVPSVNSPLGSRASQAKVANLSNLSSWSNSSKFDTFRGLSSHLHFPYADTSDSTVWCNYMTDASAPWSTSYLYRFINGVGANKSPVYDSVSYSMRYFAYRHALDCYVGDKRRVAFAGIGSTASILQNYAGLWTSTDEGDSWTLRITPVYIGAGATAAAPTGCDIAGDNPNVIYAYGTQGFIKVSYDFGETWEDKQGDLPSSSRVIRLFGG